jgi:quinoprotein glucose dehydrogenase
VPRPGEYRHDSWGEDGRRHRRQGGANWGGGSFDPQRHLFFVNASNRGQVEQLSRRDDGSFTTPGPASGRFSDRDNNLMCQQPPWGTLTAIDVDSGAIAWQRRSV